MPSDSKPINCIVAFSDGNRGIGNKGGLPWPFLKEDHEFYNAYAVRTKDPKKKNAIVLGRLTFDPNFEYDDDRVNIVVSTTMPKEATKNCAAVVRSFGEAVDLLNGPEFEHIENISVLGGTRIYEAAIEDPRCTRIVVTRVFQDFEFDAHMPPFEHRFEKVDDPEVDGKLRENNGIKFQFEIWEQKKSS